MHATSGHKSITISRKIIRANGAEEMEEVIAYWDADPEIMERVLNTPGFHIDNDGTVLPKSKNIRPATPSELMLSMSKEELEGGH